MNTSRLPRRQTRPAMGFALAGLLLATSLSAWADGPYRWVDPATGKVTISDTPIPGTRQKTSSGGYVSGDDTANTTAPGDPANPGTPANLSYAAKVAAEKYPVVLYTSADCTDPCRQGRDLLSKRKTPYTEKMIQNDDDVQQVKKLVGDAFVPVLTVGKQVYKGYSATAWNNLLDLANYPK